MFNVFIPVLMECKRLIFRSDIHGLKHRKGTEEQDE